MTASEARLQVEEALRCYGSVWRWRLASTVRSTRHRSLTPVPRLFPGWWRRYKPTRKPRGAGGAGPGCPEGPGL